MEQQLVGYKLVSIDDGSVAASWGGVLGVTPDLPNKIRLPNGSDVHCPVLGQTYDGYVLVEWFMEPPPPAPPPFPEQISDRQFFQQLALMEVITKDEALDAVKTGAIPAALKAFIDTLPAEEKFAAEMSVSGAVTFHRHHPLTNALAEGMSWERAQVDGLWLAASQL